MAAEGAYVIISTCLLEVSCSNEQPGYYLRLCFYSSEEKPQKQALWVGMGRPTFVLVSDDGKSGRETGDARLGASSLPCFLHALASACRLAGQPIREWTGVIRPAQSGWSEVGGGAAWGVLLKLRPKWLSLLHPSTTTMLVLR